jgi:hypothetical protein
MRPRTVHVIARRAFAVWEMAVLWRRWTEDFERGFDPPLWSRPWPGVGRA